MSAEALKAVLISIALVCGVSAALGALIVAAERRLLDYGICAIDINGGRRSG